MVYFLLRYSILSSLLIAFVLLIRPSLCVPKKASMIFHLPCISLSLYDPFQLFFEKVPALFHSFYDLYTVSLSLSLFSRSFPFLSLMCLLYVHFSTKVGALWLATIDGYSNDQRLNLVLLVHFTLGSPSPFELPSELSSRKCEGQKAIP